MSAEVARLRSRVAELEGALRALTFWAFGEEGESIVGRYDRIAMTFWEETHIWPPGKSAPMDMHTGDAEEARKAWEEWLTARKVAAETAARRALASPSETRPATIGATAPATCPIIHAGWCALNHRESTFDPVQCNCGALPARAPSETREPEGTRQCEDPECRRPLANGWEHRFCPSCSGWAPGAVVCGKCGRPCNHPVHFDGTAGSEHHAFTQATPEGA
jgi:hypothetical protein